MLSFSLRWLPFHVSELVDALARLAKTIADMWDKSRSLALFTMDLFSSGRHFGVVGRILHFKLRHLPFIITCMEKT